MKQRERSKLVLPRKVYLTDEAFALLRIQKKKQGRSMAAIVIDLIQQSFSK